MEQSQDLIKVICDRAKTEDQKISGINQLLQSGANINAKSVDIPNFTPLMLASDLGYTNIVKLLLEKNADVNAVDNLNTSALFYAARKGNLDIVQLLLSRGANMNLITKQGNNILLDILRSYGANLADAKDKKEQLKKNIATIIELLIDKGANVNAQGSEAEGKRTPLLWAATWKDFDLMKLLIRKKADLCAKDQFGNTITYYLPDPKKEKMSVTDANFIDFVRSEVLEKCEWSEIQK